MNAILDTKILLVVLIILIELFVIAQFYTTSIYSPTRNVISYSFDKCTTFEPYKS